MGCGVRIAMAVGAILLIRRPKRMTLRSFAYASLSVYMVTRRAISTDR